jgi:Rrf2 family protein
VKLSRRGEYALRALISLGIAAEVGRALVQVSELATNEQLPAKFLEQIMHDLKAAGLVTSVRGKYGGYRLAQPARTVAIGSVVRLLDGPLAPIGCVSQTAYEKCSCPDESHCGLRMIMLDVRNAIAGILDRYTLADIVEVTLRKLRRDSLPIPFAAASAGSRAGKRPIPRRARPVRAPFDAAEGVLHHLLGKSPTSPDQISAKDPTPLPRSRPRRSL